MKEIGLEKRLNPECFESEKVPNRRNEEEILIIQKKIFQLEKEGGSSSKKENIPIRKGKIFQSEKKIKKINWKKETSRNGRRRRQKQMYKTAKVSSRSKIRQIA